MRRLKASFHPTQSTQRNVGKERHARTLAASILAFWPLRRLRLLRPLPLLRTFRASHASVASKKYARLCVALRCVALDGNWALPALIVLTYSVVLQTRTGKNILILRTDSVCCHVELNYSSLDQ